MSLANFLKKKGKRLAGTWGRINHKNDMRGASKGIRRFRTDQEKQYVDITEEIREMYRLEHTIEELLENDETPECDHRNKEYYPHFPGTESSPEEPEGWYCPDCDIWLEPEDEATRLGI